VDGIGLASFVALVGLGIVAGIVNAIAGAGSLINIPLLAAVGMPHTVANATNRIAVVVGGITSAAAYRRANQLPWELTRPLVLPMLIGSGLGAYLATILPDRWFRPIVGLELLVLAGMLTFKPDIWLNPDPGGKNLSLPKRRLLFLAIGTYAGFLQAGVGFFLIATLVRQLGLDLVRSNAVKVVLTLAATVLSVGIFTVAGMMEWVPGLILAVGNGVGGWVGAHLAVRKGARWIRWVLVGTVVLAALEILGVYRAIGHLLGV